MKKGLFNGRHIGKGRPAEGHVFVLFVFGIIAATFLSGLLVGYLDGIIAWYTQDRLAVALVQTVVILVLLLLDMRFEL